RVTPGTSRTSAWRRPTSRLKSVDLPTFGRPTIATTGRTTEAPAPTASGGRTLSLDAGRRLRVPLAAPARLIRRPAPSAAPPALARPPGPGRRGRAPG